MGSLRTDALTSLEDFPVDANIHILANLAAVLHRREGPFSMPSPTVTRHPGYAWLYPDDVDGTVGCADAPKGPARLTNDLDQFDILQRRIVADIVRTHLDMDCPIHSSVAKSLHHGIGE